MLEAIVALCAVLTLVMVVMGSILKSLRVDQSNIWAQLNIEKQRHSDFRENVVKEYMRKPDVEDHINLRLDAINDRMKRQEAQLEQLNTSVSSFNQVIPALTLQLERFNNSVNK